MKIIKKIVSVGLVCCVGIGLLAGCEQKKVDYGIEGVTENSGGQSLSGKMGVEQFADAPIWQDELTAVDKEGDELPVWINVEPSLPGVQQMYVVEMEEPVFDEKYQEELAERLFGEGNFRQTEEAYLGEREGISYELTFLEEEKETGRDNVTRIKCRRKEIALTVQDISEVCPDSLADLDVKSYRASYSMFVGNECELSEVEALELAENFVKELDLGYSVYSRSGTLYWIYGSQWAKSAGYGYVFAFDVGVDDLSFVNFGTQKDFRYFSDKKKSKESEYSLDAQIEVYVTERGVIGMRARNPLEMIGVSSEVELLSLENVEGIISDALTNRYADLGIKSSSYVTEGGVEQKSAFFNNLKLIYFRVKDRTSERHYSYIPAWRLASELDVGYWEIENQIVINAIDGSVIDIYEEV